MKDFIAVLTYLAVIRVTTAKSAERTLPAYVKVCALDNPEFSECWKTTFQSLRPYLVEGITEFNIPSIDPLRVEKLSLNQGNSSNANYQLTMTDLDFEGGKDYEVLHVEVNMKKLTFHVVIRFPQMKLTGNYASKGRFLLFQFDSKGKVYGNYSNVVLNGTWYGKTYLKKGVKHLMLEKEDVDIAIGKMTLRFDDLFGGNARLNANINHVINENYEALFEDIKPLLSDELKKKWKNLRDSYSKHIRSEKTVDENQQEKKKKKLDKVKQPPSSPSSVEQVISYLDRKTAESIFDDIDDIFKGYAKTIKKLSRRRQAIVKFKISQYIMEQELAQLKKRKKSNVFVTEVGETGFGSHIFFLLHF